MRILSEGKDGDVCITNGRDNVIELREKGLSRSPAIRLGEITPVLQVMKGNPKKIASLADMARPGVRVVLCHEKGCLGRVSDRMLANSKLAEKVAPNVVQRVRGEQGTAKAVDGIKADVSIMWTWTILLVGPERYDMVPIPAERNIIDPLVAVMLETGKNRAGAEKFVAFLQTEKAKKILADAGLMSRK